jgi:hypothetical protein
MLLVLLLVLAQQTLAGRWTLDVSASDDINKAIEAATRDMNFIKKPIARKRLRATNPVTPRLVIRMVGDSVDITGDNVTPLRAKADGQPMTWRFKGEDLKVITTFEAGVLTNRFIAEDGERINSYRLRTDDTLEQHVRLSSPQLKRPVEYTRVFTR